MITTASLRHPATIASIKDATREATRRTERFTRMAWSVVYNSKGRVYMTVTVDGATVTYRDRFGYDCTPVVKAALRRAAALQALADARDLLDRCKVLTGSRRIFAAALARQCLTDYHNMTASA